MKKNLFQGMMATLLLLAFAITSQAKCYIIGNDNIWKTNKGVELTETEVAGVYEGEVEFATSNTWFGVVDALMEGENDWEELNSKHRFYPIQDGTPTPFNTPVKMYAYNGNDSRSFLLKTTEGGTYRVRVDFNKMEITVLKDIPSAFYLIGCRTWDVANPDGVLKITEDDGIYKGTVEFTNNEFVLSSTKGDKNDLQKYIISSIIKPNFVNSIAKGDANAQNNVVSELGTYDVTLDLYKMTLLLRKSGQPTPLYMMNGDTNWEPDHGIEFQATDKEGIYQLKQGDFTQGDNSFTLTTALSYDWELLEPYRYGNNTALVPNRPKTIYQTTLGFSSVRPGTYDVTVDMNKMSLTLHEEGYVPEYPEYIYFNGNLGQWATNLSFGTLEVSYKDGIYTGDVSFASPTFAIAKALTSEADQWDEYNQNRIGASYNNEPANINAYSSIQASTNAFTIDKQGYFHVTVDLIHNKMIILTNEPLAEGELPKEIYTIGNDDVWFTDAASTVIPAKEGEPGTYEGVLEVEEPSYGPNGKFIVLPRLSTSWNIVNIDRIGIEGQNMGEESYLLETGKTYRTTKGGQYDLEVAPGKYTLTVDLINNTLRLDNTTAIKGVKDNSVAKSEDAPYYDLYGRNLGKEKPLQGIYIKGNKKVVIK